MLVPRAQIEELIASADCVGAFARKAIDAAAVSDLEKAAEFLSYAKAAAAMVESRHDVALAALGMARVA